MAGDLYWADVKLQLHFDGSHGATTTSDVSSSAHAITANGGAQLSTARPKFGTAASEHDGAGDYWSAPNSSDFNFGSGDFTVEGWLETDTVSGPHSVIGYANGSAANSNYSFYVLSSGSQLQGAIYSGSTGYTAVKSGLVTGTKHHFALVRNGGTLTLYLDGVGGTGINVTAVTVNNPAASVLHIGEVQGFFSWDGMLDMLRITKGVARYTGNFTPPTDAFGIGFQVLPAALGPVTNFGTPTALADQMGIASSLGPVTQFGTPALLDRTVEASGAAPSTAFGQPTAVYDQTQIATGEAPSTTFGTPRLVTTVVASTIGRVTRMGALHLYRFDQTQYATGDSTTRFGRPVALRYATPDLEQIVQVAPTRSSTRFGRPTADWSIAAAASSIAPSTTFGTPAADALGRTLAASSLAPGAQFGTALAWLTQEVSGLAPATQFGTASARQTMHASSLAPRTRFGEPEAYREHSYEVYGLWVPARFGQPTAINRFNHPATALGPVAQFGTPSVKQSLRQRSMGPVARMGIPVLESNP